MLLPYFEINRLGIFLAMQKDLTSLFYSLPCMLQYTAKTAKTDNTYSKCTIFITAEHYTHTIHFHTRPNRFALITVRA